MLTQTPFHSLVISVIIFWLNWQKYGKMKLIAANSQSDLATIRMGHEITRKKSLKYLILDASINRATTRLDRGIITVSEFLNIASNFTYNPARHFVDCNLHLHQLINLSGQKASCASSSNSANWFWLCINCINQFDNANDWNG